MNAEITNTEAPRAIETPIADEILEGEANQIFNATRSFANLLFVGELVGTIAMSYVNETYDLNINYMHFLATVGVIDALVICSAYFTINSLVKANNQRAIKVALKHGANSNTERKK